MQQLAALLRRAERRVQVRRHEGARACVCLSVGRLGLERGDQLLLERGGVLRAAVRLPRRQFALHPAAALELPQAVGVLKHAQQHLVATRHLQRLR